jgi:hypothetical protein
MSTGAVFYYHAHHRHDVACRPDLAWRTPSIRLPQSALAAQEPWGTLHGIVGVVMNVSETQVLTYE